MVTLQKHKSDLGNESPDGSHVVEALPWVCLLIEEERVSRAGRREGSSLTLQEASQSIYFPWNDSKKF